MEPEVYTQVKYSIHKILGINLEHYKDEQMRRRLDSWLARTGAPNWADYFKRLRTDTNELSRFRDYLTINVSAFFRDIDRWQVLREKIAPEVLTTSLAAHPGQRGLRVWSAGCSIGAEPYTLAILLEETTHYRHHTILATDLDRSALSKARRGGPYTAEEIQGLTVVQRNTYLEPDGPPFFIRPELAKKIEFREHNLLSDPFPTGLDLIVCRNVVIYFTAEAKAMLYRKFQQALRPGGVLFVGATEIIPHPLEIGLQNYQVSFYKKTNT